MSVARPLVRNQFGAILGVDWRRVPGMTKPEYRVPGRIPADGVMPGDGIWVAGMPVTVLTVTVAEKAGGFGSEVRVHTRTRGGAPISVVRQPSELVHVVSVGAFEHVAASS